ncbi:MAG TPA: hypothetical protein DCY88_01660 [Cyanobacteria bacterium UBA11372]|nr:hypothetical protein [Cyanobacteria bacterium UBA11372]
MADLVYSIFTLPSFRPEWREARGQNSYCYYAIDSLGTQSQRISINKTITVDAGAPFLCAVLIKNNYSVDFPTGAMLTITGPDGTVYNRDSNGEMLLTFASGSSLRSLLVKNPLPGDWMISLTVSEGVEFHFAIETLPSQDVYDTINSTLSSLNSTSLVSQRLQKRSSNSGDLMGLTTGFKDATDGFLPIAVFGIQYAPKIPPNLDLESDIGKGFLLAADATAHAIGLGSSQGAAAGTSLIKQSNSKRPLDDAEELEAVAKKVKSDEKKEKYGIEIELKTLRIVSWNMRKKTSNANKALNHFFQNGCGILFLLEPPSDNNIFRPGRGRLGANIIGENDQTPTPNQGNNELQIVGRRIDCGGIGNEHETVVVLWDNRFWDITSLSDFNRRFREAQVNAGYRVPITVNVRYQDKPQVSLNVSCWHAPAPGNDSINTVATNFTTVLNSNATKVMAWMGDFNTTNTDGFRPTSRFDLGFIPYILGGPIDPHNKTVINNVGTLTNPYDKVLVNPFFETDGTIYESKFGYVLNFFVDDNLDLYVVYFQKAGRYFYPDQNSKGEKDLFDILGGNLFNFFTNYSDHLPVYADFLIVKFRLDWK